MHFRSVNVSYGYVYMKSEIKGLVSRNTMLNPDFQNQKLPIRFKIHMYTIEEGEPMVSSLCMASLDLT